MQKSGIEYLHQSWNPFSGCAQPASVCACRDKCWARSMAWRFGKNSSERHFTPAFHPERLHEPSRRKKPARIGVSFMGDLFSVEPNVSHLDDILTEVWNCPQHTFVFLTKSPERLAEVSWTKNAWVGTTVNTQKQLEAAAAALQRVRGMDEFPTRFISFEPLMENVELWRYGDLLWLDWCVIGGWQKGPQPRADWVEAIIEACDTVSPHIPVWLKDNLHAVPPNGYRDGVKRQELPV